MICPECGGKLATIDTLPIEKEIYRRKRCTTCGLRMYTREEIIVPFGKYYDKLAAARKMKKENDK